MGQLSEPRTFQKSLRTAVAWTTLAGAEVLHLGSMGRGPAEPSGVRRDLVRRLERDRVETE